LIERIIIPSLPIVIGIKGRCRKATEGLKIYSSGDKLIFVYSWRF